MFFSFRMRFKINRTDTTTYHNRALRSFKILLPVHWIATRRAVSLPLPRQPQIKHSNGLNVRGPASTPLALHAPAYVGASLLRQESESECKSVQTNKQVVVVQRKTRTKGMMWMKHFKHKVVAASSSCEGGLFTYFLRVFRLFSFF